MVSNLWDMRLFWWPKKPNNDRYLYWQCQLQLYVKTLAVFENNTSFWCSSLNISLKLRRKLWVKIIRHTTVLISIKSVTQPHRLQPIASHHNPSPPQSEARLSRHQALCQPSPQPLDNPSNKDRCSRIPATAHRAQRY